MTEKIKFIITIGLVGILAISVFVNFQTYNSKKQIEREREQLKKENDTLARKIEEASRDRKQLQEKIDALNNDLNNVSQENEDIQKRYELIAQERDQLTEKMQALQNDNKKLNKELSDLTQERQRLEQKFAADLTPIKNENTILKRQLKSLSERKIKLEKKLNEMSPSLEEKRQIEPAGSQTDTVESKEESIELPPIVVRSQIEKPPLGKKNLEGPLEGSVLDVNKENDFVVIGLGKDAGVRVGQTFRVYRYRQAKEIGTIEVIQVRNNIAACDIKQQTWPIAVGDIVRE